MIKEEHSNGSCTKGSLGERMANLEKSVPENRPGEFFVDSTCIDCDTCRQIAPATFGEAPDHAFVHHQPETPADRRVALQALVCCPTGSIGSRGKEKPATVLDDFPLLLEEPVYYCGFNSAKSYGGNSYFIRHPDGNWLIDSPKFLPRLVRRFEALGGISHVFLTHSDDVADAGRFAKHFNSKRFIHRAELWSQPDAEVVLDGEEPVRVAADFLIVPTPGHTEGHCVLLFRERFLFTGDHLAWDRHEKQLEAFPDHCWYSWPELVRSMRRLAGYSFEWVLPGHGQRVHLPREEMRRQMRRWVETTSG
jgi:glyoxylase-like metal-dependent hydrolase (beta-lactamase superfamily II)/ferredoxin